MANSGSSNRVRKPYCKKLKFDTPKPRIIKSMTSLLTMEDDECVAWPRTPLVVAGVPSVDLVDFLGVEWMSQLERCESLMECTSTPNNGIAAPAFEPIVENFDENTQPFFIPV